MHQAVAPVLLRLQALSNSLSGLFAVKPCATRGALLAPPSLLSLTVLLPSPQQTRRFLHFALFLMLFAGTFLVRAMPAEAQGTVTGTITLQGPTAGVVFNHPQLVTFEFSPASTTSGATVLVKSVLVTQSPSDTYTFNGIPAGTYNVGIKAAKWLRTIVPNVTVTDSGSVTVNATLPGGDCDNNNVVDIGDFGILVNAYGGDESIPGSGYDQRADITCDGIVDIGDFGVLVNTYGQSGPAYRISLDTPTSPALGKVALKWRLKDVSGNYDSHTPKGTTFFIYRSVGPDHSNMPYKSVMLDHDQAANEYDLSYTDTVPTTGTFYYQIVAIPTINSTPTYALSSEAQITIVPNPLIEGGGGSYTITGFQPDNATVTYQAQIINGLLNSYKVGGKELFHSEPNANPYSNPPTATIQFAPTTSLTNAYALTRGGLFWHNAPDTLPFPDPFTLIFNITDQNDLYGNHGPFHTKITYAATPTSLQLIMEPDYNMSFSLPLGCGKHGNIPEAVTAVQDLALPGQGYARLSGSGLTYSLPPPPFALESHTLVPDRDGSVLYGNRHIPNVRTMRFLLSDTGNVSSPVSSAVDFTLSLNGGGEIFPHISTTSPQNYLSDYACWGEDFTSRYIAFTLSPAPSSIDTAPLPVNTVVNPAPPFHLVLQNGPPINGTYSNGLGMYAAAIPNSYPIVTENKLYCQLEISPMLTSSLTNYQFSYYFTDFWGNKSTTSYAPISLTPADFKTDNPHYLYADLTNISLPKDSSGNILKGYYRLVGSLTPASSAPSGTTFLDNQDFADFGVYTVLNEPPYIYDVSFLPGYAPYILNPSSGGNVGQSDPSIPRILGMRSVRVENRAVTVGHYTQDQNGQYTIYNYSRNEADGTNANYGIYDLLKPFSNPAGVDANDMTVFGSIIPINAPSFRTEVSNMVSSLTSFQKDASGNILRFPQSSGPDAVNALNPIKYWSIYNEPDAETHDGGSIANKFGYFFRSTDIKRDYIQTVLIPGQLGVMDAYTQLTILPNEGIVPALRANPPQTIAPNLNALEANSRDDNYGTNNGPLTWFRDFFDGGGSDYTDIIGTHSYTGNERSWEEHGIAESLHDLRTLMQRYATAYPTLPNKPIWITEHGWRPIWSDAMPRLQGEYIVRRYALAAKEGITHEHNTYFYAPSESFDNLELWRGDAAYLDGKYHGAPNRGGMAMRILNEMTAGMAYDSSKTLDTGKYVHAVPYTDSTNETLIVWGNDFTDPQFFADGQARVTLPLNSDSADLQFFDIMGNPIAVTRQRNLAVYTYYVPATGSPVYVMGPHSASYTVGTGGWPVLNVSTETNYALNEGNLATGAQAFASSFAPVTANTNPPVFNDAFRTGVSYFCSPASTPNGPAPNLNDGSWQYDDMNSNGKGGLLPTTNNRVKSAWIGGNIYPITQPNPDGTIGDWAMVKLAAARTIDTLVAVVPSNNNQGGALCGARDYQFQVSADGTNWTTVKSVTGNMTEWVLYYHTDTPMTNIRYVRLVISKVNNGTWGGDYNDLLYDSSHLFHASPLRAMVYELEAYGPAGQ